MKDLSKVLCQKSESLQYLTIFCSILSHAEVKDDFSLAQKLRKLAPMTNCNSCSIFTKQMWKGFEAVLHDFLESNRSEQFKKIYETLIESSKLMGFRMQNCKFYMITGTKSRVI